MNSHTPHVLSRISSDPSEVISFSVFLFLQFTPMWNGAVQICQALVDNVSVTTTTPGR